MRLSYILGVVLAIILSCFSASVTSFHLNPEKHLLSSARTLTFYDKTRVKSRRHSPPPFQLECIGGDACSIHTPAAIQCRNMGSQFGESGENIQWSCSADLPATVKLGRTDVVCEGYGSPEDEYVLRGSCTCEYTLYLTDEGRKVYRKRGGIGGVGHPSISEVIGFLLIGFLIWRSFFASSLPAAGRDQPGGIRPGFGGGGPGDDDDLPPPYDPHPRPPPKPAAQQQQGSAWSPGFWSGLAGGAAAVYAANQARQRNAEQERTRRGGGGWASGGGWGDGSDGEGSSSTWSSTGFGETRRR